MTFLNPLDALIPKIPFSFFPDFWVWVTSKAWGSDSVGFWGSCQLSPFWGRGGSGRRAYRPPPPRKRKPGEFEPNFEVIFSDLVPNCSAPNFAFPQFAIPNVARFQFPLPRYAGMGLRYSAPRFKGQRWGLHGPLCGCTGRMGSRLKLLGLCCVRNGLVPPCVVDGRLGAVAKAVGGGHWWLQMPLRVAFAIRGTVAGHRLGALDRGGGVPPSQGIPGGGGGGLAYGVPNSGLPHPAVHTF